MNWVTCMAQHNSYSFDDMTDFISVRSMPGGLQCFANWLRTEKADGYPMICASATHIEPRSDQLPISKKIDIVVRNCRNGDIHVHPLLAMLYMGTKSPGSLVDVIVHSPGFMPSLDRDRLISLNRQNIQLRHDLARIIHAHNISKDQAATELERARLTIEQNKRDRRQSANLGDDPEPGSTTHLYQALRSFGSRICSCKI